MPRHQDAVRLVATLRDPHHAHADSSTRIAATSRRHSTDTKAAVQPIARRHALFPPDICDQ